MLLYEIRKITKRNEYRFTVLALVALVVLDMYRMCAVCKGQLLTDSYPAYALNILKQTIQTPYKRLFTLLLAFTGSVIAADTYMLDKKKGINNYIITRQSRKKYIWNKALAMFVVVLITIQAVLFLDLILALIAFPKYGYNLEGMQMLWGG